MATVRKSATQVRTTQVRKSFSLPAEPQLNPAVHRAVHEMMSKWRQALTEARVEEHNRLIELKQAVRDSERVLNFYIEQGLKLNKQFGQIVEKVSKEK